MESRNLWMVLIAIGLSFTLLAGCAAQGSANVPYTAPAPAPSAPSAPAPAQHYDSSGRLVLTATDAAADMGLVSSVQVRVDSVQVHSATQGWVNLNITPRTFDLLQLKAHGASALMADANVKTGAYDQMRLDISNVMVTDASGTHAAKLPSGTLSIMTDAQVAHDQTATVSFDFLADESLHVTGNGEYILAPVVLVESRDDAQVDASDQMRVRILGGLVRSHQKVGMDIHGNVGMNINIPAQANLSIQNGLILVVPGIIGINTGTQANNSGPAAMNGSGSASDNESASGNGSESGNASARVEASGANPGIGGGSAPPSSVDMGLSMRLGNT